MHRLTCTLLEEQPGPKRYLTKPSQRLQKAIRLGERLPGPGPGRYNVTVSHTHRLVWFRVAKVGSTTIMESLRDAGVTLDLEQHFGLNVPRALTPGYVRAAFVRHPTERFVSAWRNKVLKWNYLNLPDDVYARSQDLSGFIDWFATQDPTTCDPHFRLQSALIPNGKLHLLGRMETFDSDLDRLLDMIGVARVSTRQDNKAGSAPPEISSANKARIAELYKADFTRFSYTP